MCALCLNQLRIVKTLTSAQLASEFGPRVTAIGRILPMLAPWDAPEYVTRAWCLFELFTVSEAMTVD
jgi:IS1 family transposase